MCYFCGEFVRVINHKIEDRILLKSACHDGCGESLSIIYTRYRKPVCDYLHKIGADGLAEDICHDVFSRISEKRCDYNGSSNVKDYLFGIATNILRNHQRTKKEKNYPSDQLASLGGEPKVSSIPDAALALGIEEQLLGIQRNLSLLPPKSRQAIEIWLHWDEDSQAMPWDNLPCDADTFRMRLRYAINSLKGKYQNRNML